MHGPRRDAQRSLIRNAHQLTFVAVLVMFVLAGCRTYGGHGTVVANNAQLRAEAARFASEAQQASNDLQRLAASGRVDPNVIATYGDAVAEHVADAGTLTAELDRSESLNYRDASRLLGAVVTLRREYTNRYQYLLRSMVGDSMSTDPDRAARYQSVPAAWFRTTGRVFTVDEVIQGRPVTSSGRPAEAPAP
jgi:outer membrane PBP1 activator LpoA protein